MKLTTIAVSFLCFVMSQTPALASDKPIPEPVREFVERGETRSMHNREADMPVGIVFYALITGISPTDSDQEAADLEHIKRITGLDNSSAEDLQKKLVVISGELAETETRRLDNALCANGTAKVYGNDALYAVSAYGTAIALV